MSLAYPRLRGRPAPAPRVLIDPLEVSGLYHGGAATHSIPDPIEWVVSDRYLDRPRLYPRQATFLKLIFLAEDLLTQYDHDVIGEWAESFRRTGTEGVQPDVLDRVRICREQGRPWFREVVAVVGRRGSKGHMGALAGSYVLWHYMHRPGGPQEYYGIDRDKRLSAMVFAGKREQARANQWQDLVNIITGAPCYAPFISRQQTERLTIFAPADRLRAQRQALRGLETESDIASFELVPRESTLMAGRGPTAFMQHFDEMAHIVNTGANRSAEDLYSAATPSLDQFGVDAFLWEGSSPWQMTGQFYQNWINATLADEDGSPAYPEMLMLQLPSWGLYQDWEVADRIYLRPRHRVHIEVGGVTSIGWDAPARLDPLHGAIQEYDQQMRQLERANPETFAVERLSRWAAVIDAYLNAGRVEQVFAPWEGRTLVVQRAGLLGTAYVAHGDPAKVNDRFGFAIGHTEERATTSRDDDGELVVTRRRHVVFDVLHCWSAEEWEDRQIHYVAMADGDRCVEDDLWEYIRAFMPLEMTFDQFASPGTIQNLYRKAHAANLPKRTEVFEVPATERLNWVRFEVFKAALNMGLVHAPMYQADGEVNQASEIAELELRFLQRKGKRVDHPSSGPVQSKDQVDCLVEVVWKLIGSEIAEAIGESLADLAIRGVAGRGLQTTGGAERAEQERETADRLATLTARGRPGALPALPQTYHRGRPTRPPAAGWNRRR